MSAMQRIMPSRGLIPSMNAQRWKKRQGMIDEELFCFVLRKEFLWDLGGEGRYFEPDGNDAETDHGDLGGGGADPSLGVFDGNDVHELKDEFHWHDEEVCYESEEVGGVERFNVYAA